MLLLASEDVLLFIVLLGERIERIVQLILLLDIGLIISAVLVDLLLLGSPRFLGRLLFSIVEFGFGLLRDLLTGIASSISLHLLLLGQSFAGSSLALTGIGGFNLFGLFFIFSCLLGSGSGRLSLASLDLRLLLCLDLVGCVFCLFFKLLSHVFVSFLERLGHGSFLLLLGLLFHLELRFLLGFLSLQSSVCGLGDLLLVLLIVARQFLSLIHHFKRFFGLGAGAELSLDGLDRLHGGWRRSDVDGFLPWVERPLFCGFVLLRREFGLGLFRLLFLQSLVVCLTLKLLGSDLFASFTLLLKRFGLSDTGIFLGLLFGFLLFPSVMLRLLDGCILRLSLFDGLGTGTLLADLLLDLISFFGFNLCDLGGGSLGLSLFSIFLCTLFPGGLGVFSGKLLFGLFFSLLGILLAIARELLGFIVLFDVHDGKVTAVKLNVLVVLLIFGQRLLMSRNLSAYLRQIVQRFVLHGLMHDGRPRQSVNRASQVCHLGVKLQVHHVVVLIIITLDHFDAAVTLNLVELQLQELDLVILRLPVRLQMLNLVVHGKNRSLEHRDLVHHTRLLWLIGRLIPQFARRRTVVARGPPRLRRRVEAVLDWLLRCSLEVHLMLHVS